MRQIKLSDRTIGGWYCPPPSGCAVLFETDAAPERITFESLRVSANWPSNVTLDWETGLLYAYSSEVDRLTGEIADFTAFHYFGQDREVVEHIQVCRDAHDQVLSSLTPEMTSSEIHQLANRIFACSGLYVEGHSETDPSRINIGHSLTSLPTARLCRVDDLDAEDINYLSKARRFINSSDNWRLDSVRCFTIEPRLRSQNRGHLPQVSLHSIVSMTGSNVTIQNDMRSIDPFAVQTGPD